MIQKIDSKLVDEDWLYSTYFSSLSTMASTNVQYLNTTVAWSLSLTTGGFALVFSRKNFPDLTSVFILCLLLLVLTHFFVRSCKAYTNMMRFTVLQKELLDTKLNVDEATAKKLHAMVGMLNMYHVDWRSPLSRGSILKKSLFELGFLYYAVFVIGLLTWTLHSIGLPCEGILISGATISVALIEIISTFTRSPYFKAPVPLKRAVEQR